MITQNSNQVSLENTAAEDSKALISEIELDIINYLKNKTLDHVIADGFNPDHFASNIFTENKISYDGKPISISHLAIEAIRSIWEKNLTATPNEIALHSKSNDELVFALINKLDENTEFSIDQLKTRLERLRHYKTNMDFNRTIAQCQSMPQPTNNKIDFLRKGLDEIQGDSDLIFSQLHNLHRIIDEIKNPKNKPIPTGLRSFDRLIGGGLKKTELGVISGGAGAGKSAFALQLADMLAEKGICVIYYSIEIGIKALTQRSLRRLIHEYNKTSGIGRDGAFDLAVKRYETFSDNLFLIKGRNGMTVSEIRAKVLCIKKQRDQDILLIIDPFQRLGTGIEKIDYNNETIKVGHIISDIKQMAEDLEIPILALGDTTKGHKDNITGEGASRSSYMIDHVADYVIMLRTSTDPLIALYGQPNKSTKDSIEIEDPFLESIKSELASGYFNEQFKLNSKWDRYAALVTPKVRDSGRFSPLYLYHPAFNLFEETSLWDSILPNDDN